MLKFFVLTSLLAVIALGSRLPESKSTEHHLQPRSASKIVDGTETTIEAIPYQISVGYYDIPNRMYSHRCGGSIISDVWVITAGHCLTRKNAIPNNVIRSGSGILWGGFRSYNLIKNFYIHPHYHKNARGVSVDDIALIRVLRPFKFGLTRQPVQLYDKNEEALPGSMAIVSGWGSNGHPNEALPRSGILNFIRIPIMSKAKCKSVRKNRFEWTGQICAGYAEVGKDPCKGDSGGPLTIDGRLAGIVSYSTCGIGKKPGVYTEVAYYRDWIKMISNV